MLEKWRKHLKAEKLKYQCIVIAFIVVGYAIIYSTTSSALFEAETALSRKLNRIETRTEMEDFDIGNLNPKLVAKKVDEINRQLVEIREGRNELDSGFAAVDSTEDHQQLMLEISTLASRTGVEMLSIARKGFRSGDGGSFAPVDPVLGRPLLELTANSQFGPLLDFFHGLKDMSYYVSVVNIKVYAHALKNNNASKVKDLPPGTMYISLQLTM